MPGYKTKSKTGGKKGPAPKRAAAVTRKPTATVAMENKKATETKASEGTTTLAGGGAGAPDAASIMSALGGLQGGQMFAQRAAEKREGETASSSMSQLTPQQLDDLWERFNSEQAREDESFEIWPDIALQKDKKQAKATSSTSAAEGDATVEDEGEYDFEQENTLDDVVYPATLMPAVEERSMDQVLGVPQTEDGNPSLLARIMDPDSGGKGKNKTGLHGLISQPKKIQSARERLRQRIRAQRKQRAGMTTDQMVFDKRGKQVRGARQVTEEDIQSGVVKTQNMDREATREAIKANITKMKAEMAAKKEQEGNSGPAAGEAQGE